MPVGGRDCGGPFQVYTLCFAAFKTCNACASGFAQLALFVYFGLSLSFMRCATMSRFLGDLLLTPYFLCPRSNVKNKRTPAFNKLCSQNQLLFNVQNGIWY